MITRFAKLSSRLAVFIGFVFTITACGGGGGGGGGFLGETDGSETPVVITTAGLPEASEGTSYTALIKASGGREPYTWTILDDGGTGFSINSDGFLTGQAPPKGEYGITIEVADKDRQKDKLSTILNVTVGPDSLAIATTALPNGQDGIDYRTIVEATGGEEPYSWAVLNDGGTGFVIDNEGFLTGVAPESGQYGLTLEVTDAIDASDKTSYIFTVTGDAPQPLKIATTSLPNAEEERDYTAILEAVGGQGDYMWTLVSGGGSGLNLRDDGVLSGTAPGQGQYPLTVSVQDDTRTVQETLILNVTADSSPLTITTSALPGATVNESYAAVVNASGGEKPYTWRLISNGGSGLSLTPAGVLSGSPSTAGSFGLTFQVSDTSSRTDQKALILEVAPEGGSEAPPLAITTASLPDADQPLYAAALSAIGGIKPYTWSGGDTSNPGTGFVVDPASGSLTGSTDGLLPGQYGYSVTVTDDAGNTDIRSYAITVPGGDPEPASILTANPLPDAQVGLAYSTILQAAGGSGGFLWSVIDTAGFPGTPPSFGGSPTDAENGILTWAAPDIAVGNYLITIKVEDGDSSTSATVVFDLEAVPAP